MTSIWRCSSLLTTLLLPASTAQADELQTRRYADFDNYVLASSWQTGFCQSQHERDRQEPDEYRLQEENADKVDFLTVHGLWSSLPKSIAARGVDSRRWMRFGCTTRPIPNLPEARASRKCAVPETGLSLESAAKLSVVMSGAGGRSCLERCEYAKHGACFGLDPGAYLGTMARLNNEVKNSEVGKFLVESYGKTVGRNASDAAVARNQDKENVKAVRLSRHGNPVYLIEIQLSLKTDNANQTLFAQSLLPQPHPGSCGKQFTIDKVGYWNSWPTL